MNNPHPAFSITAMLIGVVAAGTGFFWLWREYSLIAVLISIFLLSGGVLWFPYKSPWLHPVSVGICIGAFVGTLLALGNF
ncbi:MAG: hypothetical protein LBE50_00735 [Gallionellaceae bacterium]|nr:hypothetical protein [Gallionellaceae bacterium]